MHHSDRVTPYRTRLAWLAAAGVAAVGLALRHGRIGTIPGLTEPVVCPGAIRTILLAAAGLFALSQVLLAGRAALMVQRLGRWWPNVLAILAAAVWWWLDRPREPLLLDLMGAYLIAVGAWGVARAGLHAITQGGGSTRLPSPGWRLAIGALCAVLLAGTVLALPVCWQGVYPVSWAGAPAAQIRGRLWLHWLDCTFTAAAALTGTGLTVRDIGCEFSRTGHVVLLILMQAGGLAVLAIGACAGWRLRNLIGWGAADDDHSPRGMRRLVASVFLLALLLEAAGAALLYSMWDEAVDANFADGGDPVLASVFQAVSAFCNVGLCLSRDSLIGYRGHWAVYAAIGPLMILGSVGGPVLCELVRRLLRRRGLGLTGLSRHSAVVLVGSIGLIAGVAGLLVFIESTPGWQLRHPNDNTPGRLLLRGPATEPAPLPVPAAVQARTRAQRLATMAPPDRWKAALFLSAAARTAGLRTARLDEASLSPGSRFVLAGAMLIGGDAGGTAGGLRIMIVLVLLASVRFAGLTPDTSRNFWSPAGRPHAVAIAAGLAVAMALLVAATALVLVYREAGSTAACAFEAVSACCNVGFSTGLTPQLSTQGRVAVILAMLLGRVIPLAFLMRSLRVPILPTGPGPEPLDTAPMTPALGR